ncbi:hypothetical protein ACFL2H_09710 [Planctomycetota bacterium]
MKSIGFRQRCRPVRVSFSRRSNPIQIWSSPIFSRRNFIGVIPVSALAISGVRAAQPDQSRQGSAIDGTQDGLIASPPVVQNPRPNSFGVSVAVTGFATAWAEYGFSEDDLRFTAIASHHGLIQADDQVLHVRVNHADVLPTDRPVFYRVVVQPLSYISAYQLERGETQATQTYAGVTIFFKSISVRLLRV